MPTVAMVVLCVLALSVAASSGRIPGGLILSSAFAGIVVGLSALAVRARPEPAHLTR